MPLTSSEANDIMRRMGRVFPTTIQMITFKDAYECQNELGQTPEAPAFYSGGTIYVILDRADYETCVMLVAHEIGHQYFDPGHIVPYYIVVRLYIKRKALDRSHIPKVQRMYNVSSDITVNNIIWNYEKFDAEFGVKTIENAFEKFYKVIKAVNDLENGNFDFMKRQPFEIVRGGMALGWMKRYNPTKHKDVITKMPEYMSKYFLSIDYLIKERDLAIRDVQKYYHHVVELLEYCGKAGLM